MKKLLILILTCNVFYGQTYNDKFLDGTIIFKLKNFVEISEENVTNTSDNIGVIVDDIVLVIQDPSVLGVICIISDGEFEYLASKRKESIEATKPGGGV